MKWLSLIPANLSKRRSLNRPKKDKNNKEKIRKKLRKMKGRQKKNRKKTVELYNINHHFIIFSSLNKFYMHGVLAIAPSTVIVGYDPSSSYKFESEH